jgi:hypothetical protein
MNCSDFEMNVRVLVRAELIDAARRDTILGHAANCPQCSERLSGEQALIAGVRAVVAELDQQSAPGHVRTSLLTAFREHAATTAGNKVVPMPVKVARHWRLESAAAAILMAVSMGAIFWMSNRSPVGEKPALIVSLAPPPNEKRTSAVVTGKSDIEIPGSVIITPTTKTRPRVARHRPKATEEVTEFFPLMEGIDLDSLEAVQAVRVELPASALNDLGLQTNQDSRTGPVKADVLLGIDGIARAIRFVR